MRRAPMKTVCREKRNNGALGEFSLYKIMPALPAVSQQKAPHSCLPGGLT